MQRSALCRSRRELSNEYLLAKIGVDTAENELLQVLFNIIQYYSIVSLAVPHIAGRLIGEDDADIVLPRLHFLGFDFRQRVVSRHFDGPAPFRRSRRRRARATD